MVSVMSMPAVRQDARGEEAEGGDGAEGGYALFLRLGFAWVG